LIRHRQSQQRRVERGEGGRVRTVEDQKMVDYFECGECGRCAERRIMLDPEMSGFRCAT
jgi:ribosomal protein L34E